MRNITLGFENGLHKQRDYQQSGEERTHRTHDTGAAGLEKEEFRMMNTRRHWMLLAGEWKWKHAIWCRWDLTEWNKSNRVKPLIIILLVNTFNTLLVQYLIFSKATSTTSILKKNKLKMRNWGTPGGKGKCWGSFLNCMLVSDE